LSDADDANLEFAVILVEFVRFGTDRCTVVFKRRRTSPVPPSIVTGAIPERRPGDPQSKPQSTEWVLAQL